MKLRKAPTPPENVRVVFADGTSKGVEVRYIGRHRGQHRWVVTQPLTLMLTGNPPVGIAIQVLPPKTSVELEFHQ